MAVSTVVGVLLITVIVRCEPMLDSYSYRNEASQFGDLLRPPPPPPLSIHPVPFHGAPVRSAHQSGDISYQYQVPAPPPPPPLMPITAPSDFKQPAPFYRQYNFNFVPQPQPFTTTPSPTMFQKVSQWLFPSQQISDDINNSPSSYSIPQKKDCNPCNFAPWIPVIRYDVTKNHDNPKPVYGVPNPSGSNILNSVQNLPQRFNKNSDPNHFSTDGSHVTYGLPKQTFGESNIFTSPSSTYGPPSHTVTISHTLPSVNPFVSSSYDISSNSYSSPLSNHNSQNVYSSLTSSSSIYITQSSTLAPSISNYNEHTSSQRLPNKNYVEYSSTVNPSHDFQLPKVEQPTQFKNSYGEPIVNSYALDIPYSVSSTGAESHKVNTEVLPDSNPLSNTPNVSIALSNPAPFSLNKGRNIHTLQPVALPNLSVSPLPPIFNARPFRPFAPKYLSHSTKGNDQLDQHINNLNIAKSIPIAEFVHSVEYPAIVTQSPVIDIDTNKINNQTKAYRNIPHNFIVDDFRDISPQASEDHISAANSHPDASFESTGADYGSVLYDSGIATELKQMSVPSNHNPVFADLRGLEDEDIDKYRTESNLQHIDSPLLYLKPNAPHKSFSTFISPTTPRNVNEYEIYDEVVTTEAPQVTTLTSAWDESRMYYAQDSPEKPSNINRAKVVQIIIPYTNADQEKENKYDNRDWPYTLEKDFRARKVQTQTESSNRPTGSYESSSTTELPTSAVTEYYNSDNINTQPNDQYEVKEAPFDIIRLQHTIDAWTQQEYTKDYKVPNKTRPSEKYAKQIPDDFLTTLSPLTTSTDNYNYNYDLYDHEGSSSIQYTVRHNKTNNISPKPFMHYNTIDRSKINHDSGKNDELREIQKLHIYTAASKFRKLTTTPPPWGYIQTSISPLTKEKVYVVTSKPWREKSNFSNEDESKVQSRSSHDDIPFKSPRFSNRPPMGEQSDVFTKGWHQIINNLESRMFTGSTSLEDTSKEEGRENEESKSESQS
ncbi:unnamed protein product [Pieris brassicae]|uniref:Uncharacterized protein n=1 Tax=Pieris brassicae TaxID=7116 RepID=A0A9P0SYE3_PIEBR|nr:unnamed protein product [Pieris brassicae]